MILYFQLLYFTFTFTFEYIFIFIFIFIFILSIFRDGWVDYLELSKRTDFNPSTTTFFWYLDKAKLEKCILEHSYKTIFNLRSRWEILIIFYSYFTFVYVYNSVFFFYHYCIFKFTMIDVMFFLWWTISIFSIFLIFIVKIISQRIHGNKNEKLFIFFIF